MSEVSLYQPSEGLHHVPTTPQERLMQGQHVLRGVQGVVLVLVVRQYNTSLATTPHTLTMVANPDICHYRGT